MNTDRGRIFGRVTVRPAERRGARWPRASSFPQRVRGTATPTADTDKRLVGTRERMWSISRRSLVLA